MLVSCASPEQANPIQNLSPQKKVDNLASNWLPLSNDKIHDPKNSSLILLQEPIEALSTLPANKLRMNVGTYRTTGLTVNMDGNKVDWVQAIKDKLISPRRVLTSSAGIEKEELVMDMDMFLDIGGSMPIVRFPHLAHTMWLACSNCHPKIFVPQSGENPISMEKILSGEQCGICHRAVAFPPTDCARCHSIRHGTVEANAIKSEFREKAAAKEKARKEQIKLNSPGVSVNPIIAEKSPNISQPDARSNLAGETKNATRAVPDHR